MAILPHLKADLIMAAYEKAGGKEIASGKFASPESSAALAANVFGFFYEHGKAFLFPRTGKLSVLSSPVLRLDLERSLRFPWRGGLHPWLDAVIETENMLAGIESKRFEPFRGAKAGGFSDAYDRHPWPAGLAPFVRVKDALKSGALSFHYLDAVQLVKHAFGIATQAGNAGKQGLLIYAYSEPLSFSKRRISPDEISAHRKEIAVFAERVQGADVRFIGLSHLEFLAECVVSESPALRAHAEAVRAYLGEQFR